MRNRKKELEKHSRQRSYLRYGLTRDDLCQINKLLRAFFDEGAHPSSDIMVLARQSGTHSKVALLYKERWIVVIYHKAVKHTVTFLHLTDQDCAQIAKIRGRLYEANPETKKEIQEVNRGSPFSESYPG